MNEGNIQMVSAQSLEGSIYAFLMAAGSKLKCELLPSNSSPTLVEIFQS